MYCLQETHFRGKDTLKVKGWKRESMQMKAKKERRVSYTYIRNKQKTFTTYFLIRDKEGHYIKGSIQ